jgi:hypothetical protein
LFPAFGHRKERIGRLPARTTRACPDNRRERFLRLVHRLNPPLVTAGMVCRAPHAPPFIPRVALADSFLIPLLPASPLFSRRAARSSSPRP